MSQGRKVIISGHLRTDSYTNKGGTKVYITDVVIDEMKFADEKGAVDKTESTPAYECTCTED